MFGLYVVALAALAVGIACLGAIAGQRYERRRWERRLLMRADLLDNPARTAPDDRMEHLEQAVDAIALELDRVGEGQRFMTKILAERRRDENRLPTSS